MENNLDQKCVDTQQKSEKVNTTDYVKELINLGVEIGIFEESYKYDGIMQFLKGESQSCYDFDRLKPLYDKYGYSLVNSILLERYNDKHKEDK